MYRGKFGPRGQTQRVGLEKGSALRADGLGPFDECMEFKMFKKGYTTGVIETDRRNDAGR